MAKQHSLHDAWCAVCVRTFDKQQLQDMQSHKEGKECVAVDVKRISKLNTLVNMVCHWLSLEHKV